MRRKRQNHAKLDQELRAMVPEKKEADIVVETKPVKKTTKRVQGKALAERELAAVRAKKKAWLKKLKRATTELAKLTKNERYYEKRLESLAE